jgi:hypothetical protein
LKDRVGAIENVKLGSESHKTDQRQSIGSIVGIAGALFGLVMVVIAAITFAATMN